MDSVCNRNVLTKIFESNNGEVTVGVSKLNSGKLLSTRKYC